MPFCAQIQTFEATEAELSLKSSLSKKELDRTGDILASKDSSSSDRDRAISIVSEWRASHTLPLRATYMMLRRAALAIDPQAVTSRRLKRMESIIAKLERGTDTHGKISTMQDIGGCRVVFPRIDQVGAFANLNKDVLENENFKIRNNYILQPKEDGYRGIHAVLRYKANNPLYSDWDGLRIEIQVRTRIQHAWATALETVDLFSNQKLKWGQGDSKWKRFFALTSTLFALREGVRIVPGTTANSDQLKDELNTLWTELDILPNVTAWSRTVESFNHIKASKFNPRVSQMSTFLVVMDITRQELRITPYSNEEMTHASNDYAHAEEEFRRWKRGYAVLVAVEAIEQLREAYPNLYGDATVFVEEVRTFLGTKGIQFPSYFERTGGTTNSP